jgi:hypothetical protein
VWQEATQHPAGQEAQEGCNERRQCNERQRHRRMRGGGVTRGNTTTSQSGQQERCNKGVQQEAKVQRELDAPANGRCSRDSPVLRICSKTKGKKGGLGRMPTAQNICVILIRSEVLGGGGYVVIFSKGLILEKLFKHPVFLAPACDGQHGYQVASVKSGFIEN